MEKRTMNTKALTVIQLANEVRELAADCEHVDEIPDEVMMRLEWLAGFAAAVRTIYEKEVAEQ